MNVLFAMQYAKKILKKHFCFLLRVPKIRAVFKTTSAFVFTNKSSQIRVLIQSIVFERYNFLFHINSIIYKYLVVMFV